MLKIAVTGGIGSGKSVVCKIFGILNIPVFNADFEAKKLLNNDPIVRSRLRENFGNEIFSPDSKIDKQKLSSIIFNNNEKLTIVNSILHPLVMRDYEYWVEEHSNCHYNIMEAAIIIEGGFYAFMDYVVLVISPMEIKINRIVNRDKCDKEVALKKMENQLDDESKIKRAHFLIYNDEKQFLIPQVLKIHENLLELTKKNII